MTSAAEAAAAAARTQGANFIAGGTFAPPEFELACR